MEQPLLFKIWVYRDAITKGFWLELGAADVRSDIASEDRFFKQDPITGGLAIHHSDYAATNWEKPASLSECEGLECAAVWEAGHVEDRLDAYFRNEVDQWSKSLAIDMSRVPADQHT
ncbi:MAG: hypothetical protein GY789_30050 [Hyphomicrobiales bacterium]|nr:hypothetical protein [Hyphomicrobiales bacterium]